MKQDLHAFAARWFDEVWNQRLISTLDEMMAPDCVGEVEGGTVRNRDEFKVQQAALLEAFPDFRIEVADIVVEGRNVVTRWQVSATHRGNSLGIAPTGISVSIRGMTWLKVENGLIVCGWDSWNQGALLQFLNAEAEKLAKPNDAFQKTHSN